jgi:hypothetical protein
MRTGSGDWFVIALGVLLSSLVPLASAGAAEHEREGDSEGDGVVIRVLSSRPYLVSGGSALVQIAVSRDVSLDGLRVILNGQDVTSLFHADSDRRALTGLATGMRLGRNVIEAVNRRHRLASLRMTNYPITGPIVSGPHLQPYICQTQSFLLPDGTTLGPPLDANCSAPTTINYVYMSTAGGPFRPLPAPSVLPPDVAMTTTLDGITVPFVVRVETGTMDRGIYQNDPS